LRDQQLLFTRRKKLPYSMTMVNRKFYNRLNFYRKLFQLFSLGFLILIPVLITNQIYAIIGNLYSVTIFGIDIVDPAMALQTTLLTREFITVLIAGALIPIIVALLFGKVFCSWMCPFNTFSEYWQIIMRKIFPNRWRLIQRETSKINPKPLTYWVILIAFFLLSLIFGFPVITFLSFPGILSSEISHLIMGMGVGIEILVVFGVILAEGFLLKRYWCKLICPVGGLLGIFRTPKTLRLNHNEGNCSCGGALEPCGTSCPLGLAPKHEGLYPHCFNCGLCIKTCEKTGFGALSFGFGKNSKDKKN